LRAQSTVHFPDAERRSLGQQIQIERYRLISRHKLRERWNYSFRVSASVKASNQWFAGNAIT
jgi:hypothetical protein